MKFKISKLLLLILFTYFLSSCENMIEEDQDKLPDNREKVTISQGIWGNVWFWEGDFMPSTSTNTGGKITPVQRDIYIYKATSYKDVNFDSGGNSSFIKEIHSEFINKVTSDKDGFFELFLPPGKYSCFVKEDTLFYGNLSDNDGILMPTEVNSNNITKRQIDINYRAVY